MTKETTIEVLSDKTSLIDRASVLVKEKILAAIASKNRCAISLSGGSTPKPLYERISQESLPWEKIHVFWGDERYVSPTDPDSNQRMVRQAWLDQVKIPSTNIHPMPTSAENPEVDALNYQEELLIFFGTSLPQIPVFDIVLLGMGDDGHTASLFPNTEALNVRDQLVTVGNKDGDARLTFSVPLINNASCVIFLVAGASKQPALEQIFAASGDDRAYPSRLIKPQGELFWLLDQAAGAQLNNQH